MTLARLRKNWSLQLLLSLQTATSRRRLLSASNAYHGKTNVETFLADTIISEKQKSIYRLRDHASYDEGRMAIKFSEGIFVDPCIAFIRDSSRDLMKLEKIAGVSYLEIGGVLKRKHGDTALRKILGIDDDEWGAATKGDVVKILGLYDWWLSLLKSIAIDMQCDTATDAYAYLSKPIFKQLRTISQVSYVSSLHWDADRDVFDNILYRLDFNLDCREGFIPEWISKGTRNSHFNAFSNNEYSYFYSWLMLNIVSTVRGYESNRWATKKQWDSRRFSIRKDQILQPAVVFHFFRVEDNQQDFDASGISFGEKISIVYNAEQVQDSGGVSYEDHVVPPVDAIEERVCKFQINIDHASDPAYNPECDVIYMPNKEFFFNPDRMSHAEAYYATLLHEIIHWTGHKSRLNRDRDIARIRHEFVDEEFLYGFEELVAELGASFLNSRFSIRERAMQNQVNYLHGWMNHVSRSDAEQIKMLKKASVFAHKASNYFYFQTLACEVAKLHVVTTCFGFGLVVKKNLTQSEINECGGVSDAFEAIGNSIANDLIEKSECEPICDEFSLHQYYGSISLEDFPKKRNRDNRYLFSFHISMEIQYDEKYLDDPEDPDAGVSGAAILQVKKGLLWQLEYYGYDVKYIDYIDDIYEFALP